MTSKLYEWVAIYRPLDGDGNEIKNELKVAAEGKLFATDTQKVILQIAKLLPPEYDNKTDDIEITLRPF